MPQYPDGLQNNQSPMPQKWYKKRWGVAIIVLVFLMVLFFVLLSAAVLGVVKNIRNNKSIISDINVIDRSFLDNSQKSPARQLAEKTDRPQFGNPKAPLVIVEFSDFQCPVSKAEFPIIREIINKYKDDILFIYRQYPAIDDNSSAIAEASLCGNEQGKFWQMHDQLFARPEESITLEMARAVAQRSGLDLAKYDECLKSGRNKAKVTEDAQDGDTLGVRGTPTFFINGNKVEGAAPLDVWETIMAKVREILGK